MNEFCGRCGRPIYEKSVLALDGFIYRWHPKTTGEQVVCPAALPRQTYCKPLQHAEKGAG